MIQSTGTPAVVPAHAGTLHDLIEFRWLLENLPAGAYVCNRQGLITYFNQHAVALWGRAPALNDPLDRFCGSFKLYLPDGTPIEHDRCWMALALQTGQEYIGQEIVIERPDGVRITALAHAHPIRTSAGEILGAINVLVDITHRKRTESDLLAVKDQLASQLSDLRRLHAMSVRLSTTLELQPILDEALRTATAVEGTDLGLLALCDPEKNHLRVGASMGFDEKFLQAIEHVPSGGGACGTCFQQRRRIIVEDVETDELFVPYREVARTAGFRAVHSTPLITRNGRILGVLSTHFRRPHRPTDREIHLIDVAARQAVDFIENAQLYEQLREADRRKDEFLATLAHELRNPLAPISNSIALLGMSDDLTPAVERVRQVMQRQVDHMVRLVDDLLEVSRITRGKIELRTEPVELATVVSSAVETSRPLIEAAGHQLAISLPPEPIRCEADPLRLAQVIANLLNNAAKYTPAGGQIWLTARREANQAVVSIKDTGVGIPPDMLPRVFDLFAQVDRTLNRSQGGLGIGLSLAKGLIEMHGGTIEAKSDGPERGSEFIVRLPLPAVGPRSRPVTDDTGGAHAPARACRVLVVDDARDTVYILGKMLEAMGHAARTTQSSTEALEMARAERFDIVISDIGMPDVDGFELARRLRQEPGLEHTLLVALTGYGQESDRQGAIEAGFDHYLVKPVSLQSLGEVLAAAARKPLVRHGS